MDECTGARERQLASRQSKSPTYPPTRPEHGQVLKVSFVLRFKFNSLFGVLKYRFLLHTVPCCSASVKVSAPQLFFPFNCPNGQKIRRSSITITITMMNHTKEPCYRCSSDRLLGPTRERMPHRGRFPATRLPTAALPRPRFFQALSHCGDNVTPNLSPRPIGNATAQLVRLCSGYTLVTLLRNTDGWINYEPDLSLSLWLLMFSFHPVSSQRFTQRLRCRRHAQTTFFVSVCLSASCLYFFPYLTVLRSLSTPMDCTG
ncbi:hypothetical protein BKA70DRAFT_97111 [Coprinopsis sp. MPI-PUGE-AT-0042]|nr:hypothetical protein BKA70DRAFT_97111 [Coprinopsis sp. MPI-PUGE-AT-0042]